MAERDLKKYLLTRVKELKGEARKTRWEGRNSAPDWRVMLPGVVPFWLELKDYGEVPTLMQAREHMKMRKLGEAVYWANTPEMVEAAIEEQRYA